MGLTVLFALETTLTLNELSAAVDDWLVISMLEQDKKEMYQACIGR